MAERDQFDDRLSTAVRALADGARTQVNAVEVAERAIDRVERQRRLGWTRALLPTPAWVLLLLALLLLAFAWGLGVGGSHDDRAPGVLTPIPTPTAPADAASPSPTPDPRRAGHVSGDPYVTVRSAGQSSQAGDETRVAGLVYDLQEDVDDPRVAGFGTVTLDTSGTADMGYGSGSIQIDGADGGWEGTCTSASWDAGRSIELSCWLSGTGAYDGLTYYRYSLTGDAGNAFDGLIIAAPRPSP